MPRPKKPVELKVLSGTYRPSRHGPKPLDGVPLTADAPKRLDDDERRAWADIVEAGGGRLVEPDALLVELAAALVAKRRRGEAKAADVSNLLRVLGMLQLDPGHRQGLPPPADPENPFDEF